MRSPLDIVFGALGGFVLAIIMFAAGGLTDSTPTNHPSAPAPLHIVTSICQKAAEVTIYQYNSESYFGIKYTEDSGGNKTRYDLTWFPNQENVAVEKNGIPAGTEPISVDFSNCLATKPHVEHKAGE